MKNARISRKRGPKPSPARALRMKGAAVRTALGSVKKGVKRTAIYQEESHGRVGSQEPYGRLISTEAHAPKPPVILKE